MQRQRSRWTGLGSAAVVAIGLLAFGRPAVADDESTTIPNRRLSDSAAWEAWTASFHMTDTGPVNRPPAVPGRLPPVPLEAAAVPAPQPPVAPAKNACDTCDGRGTCTECQATCDLSCTSCDEGLFDNTYAFIAGDGWKNIFDDDDSSNFGFRTGFNMGVDLPGDRAVCGQLGMSYGAYDFYGRESLLSRDDPIEQRVFATAGVYKRSDVAADDCLAWGAVYDLLVADEAGERVDSLRLAQVRPYVGYALTECDEVGVWAAFRLMRDYATQQRVTVNVTDQANLFWHRNWSRGGDTWAYAGWADDPGSIVVGLRGETPLSSRVALMGNLHYIIPSTHAGDVHPTLGVDDCFNQEAWNVSFGIVFYRCAKAISPNVSGYRGLPLIPVADNGSFSYQAPMFR